jgi:hypothetical protein
MATNNHHCYAWSKSSHVERGYLPFCCFYSRSVMRSGWTELVGSSWRLPFGSGTCSFELILCQGEHEFQKETTFEAVCCC